MNDLKNALFGLLGLTFLFLSACKKVDSSVTKTDPPTQTTPAPVDGLNIDAPDGFDYVNDQNVQVNISVLNPDNSPVKQITVNILSAPEEDGGKILFTGISDDNGVVTGNLNLPGYIGQVVVDPLFAGIIRNAAVAIVGGQITATIGGTDDFGGNVIPNSVSAGRAGSASRALSNYSFMGSYNSQGKPDYLYPINATVTCSLLSNINKTLPEHKSVAVKNPVLLSSSSVNNINLVTSGDVWFTFLSEGTRNKNTIAYFSYPTNAPPTSTSQIDSLHIILPNASLSGSGGGLHSGNQVNLGHFSAGTSIGFALIVNGWDANSVGSGDHIFYSVDQLNPEVNANLKRHAVLLSNSLDHSFILGFEEKQRDQSGADHDFNDCIFSISSTTNNCISNDHINGLFTCHDSDGDGVEDEQDEYYSDYTAAYNKFYPSSTGYGTITFEDNWPTVGDYDMNDLVVGYQYKFVNDRNNRTKEIDASFILKAAGATMRSGFGVQFPFAPSLVQSVTGSRVQNNQVISFAGNGCESGQSKAVIIPFDDAFSVLQDNNGFINTFPSVPFTTMDTIKMVIKLNTPISATTLGNAPFNPFIIINKTRGREMHLPGMAPTDKVDTHYFKTGQDDTDPSQHKYYKTISKLPYALNFAENFNYPTEGSGINKAYLKFISWAQSGGVVNKDWYKDPANIYWPDIFQH